jgi:transcription elongation factor Elf1
MHSLPYEIDCQECGCADVEVDRRPRPGEWFASGLARCNNCGAQWSFRKPEGVKEQADQASPEPRGAAVIYTPVKCPHCRSADVPVQHSELPVRYHKCRSCGESFKSVEH